MSSRSDTADTGPAGAKSEASTRWGIEEWWEKPAAIERWVTAIGLWFLAGTLSTDLEAFEAPVGGSLLFWTSTAGLLLVVLGTLATGRRLDAKRESNLTLTAVALSGAIGLSIIGLRTGYWGGDAQAHILLYVGIGSLIVAYGLLFTFTHGVHRAISHDSFRSLFWIALGLAAFGLLWRGRNVTEILGIGLPLVLVGLDLAPKLRPPLGSR